MLILKIVHKTANSISSFKFSTPISIFFFIYKINIIAALKKKYLNKICISPVHARHKLLWVIINHKSKSLKCSVFYYAIGHVFLSASMQSQTCHIIKQESITNMSVFTLSLRKKNDLGDDIYVCGKIKTTHVVNTMMLLFYCLFDIYLYGYLFYCLF